MTNSSLQLKVFSRDLFPSMCLLREKGTWQSSHIFRKKLKSPIQPFQDVFTKSINSIIFLVWCKNSLLPCFNKSIAYFSPTPYSAFHNIKFGTKYFGQKGDIGCLALGLLVPTTPKVCSQTFAGCKTNWITFHSFPMLISSPFVSLKHQQNTKSFL